MKTKAIIFDLDDTLYPEEQYVLSGFRAVAEWTEIKVGISKEVCYQQLSEFYFRGTRKHTFDLFLKANKVHDISLVAEMVQVYRNHEPLISPFPGVPELLCKLSKEYLLGIISDGYLEVQKRKWASLNLITEFHAIIFSDLWGRSYWKPSQKPFIEALQKLEIKASNACYIGDNPVKDFFGAKSLGMYTVMIKRPGGVYSSSEPPTPQHTADFIIDDLAKLQKDILSNWWEGA